MLSSAAIMCCLSEPPKVKQEAEVTLHARESGLIIAAARKEARLPRKYLRGRISCVPAVALFDGRFNKQAATIV
jgi:hypothetical protein